MSARGIASALVLVVAGLTVAWLCVRTTVVGLLPPGAPATMQIAPDNALAVLGRAMVRLGQQRGVMNTTPPRLDTATIDAVRQAAMDAPLDERYFLVLGYQQLAEGRVDRAVKSLEAAQRLNPRNRLVHLLLLERYLLANRYADAAAQFSVSARLTRSAQPAIAALMAQMAMDPDMQNATRQTLRSDPRLERAVLTTLAKGASDPGDIFALASPAALADAGNQESWGPVLVARLVETGRFPAARAVWQRVYGLADAQIAAPIFNPTFQQIPASSPFNWTLTASGLGAADPQRGGLSVDYYGRDSGDLASQLLVLTPGRYQLAFQAEGGKPDAASRLFWTVSCAQGDKAVLTNLTVPTTPGQHRIAGAFAVPAGCVAQTLALRGEAGEFPSPVTLKIDRIVIRALTKATS